MTGSSQVLTSRHGLFKILTNTFISQYRKAAGQPQVGYLEDEEEFYLYRKLRAPGSPPLSESRRRSGAEPTGARPDIEAIESLPEPYRLAIVLVDIEGFSYKEIAEMNRVKVGTVMSRIARGRKMLQHLLGDYFQAAKDAGDDSSS